MGQPRQNLLIGRGGASDLYSILAADLPRHDLAQSAGRQTLLLQQAVPLVQRTVRIARPHVERCASEDAALTAISHFGFTFSAFRRVIAQQ